MMEGWTKKTTEEKNNVERMKWVMECDLRKTDVKTEEENEEETVRRVGKQGWLVGEGGMKNKEEDEKKELEMEEEMEDVERYGKRREEDRFEKN